jgi:tRNA 2-thiouridine synthesizing protein A
MGGKWGSSGVNKDEPVLDVRFHRCPLPVLRTRKALSGLAAGAHLTVLATDPAAPIDMAHFCATEGHELLSAEEEAGVMRFRIRRGCRAG